jgi:hypothetical protein
MAKRSSTKSETPVAARAALDEQSPEAETSTDRLEQQAKEQEKEQRQALREGQVNSGPLAKVHDEHQRLLKKNDVASVRAGVKGVLVTQGGQIDNMTRASDADALEGHFCKIDLSHKSLDKDLKDYLGERDYGVYLAPGSLDPETGRPVLAQVRLRDDTGETVTVPYEALRPSLAGGR